MSRYLRSLAAVFLAVGSFSFTVVFEGQEPSAGVETAKDRLVPKRGIASEEHHPIIVAPVSVVFEEKETPSLHRDSGEVALTDGFEDLEDIESAPAGISRSSNVQIINNDFKEIEDASTQNPISPPLENFSLLEALEDISDTTADHISWKSDETVVISGFDSLDEDPCDSDVNCLSRDIAAVDPTEVAPFDQEEISARERDPTLKTTIINFNNVGIIEYVRFVSRITGRSFLFDEKDLNFNVTVISEEPTSAENVMTTLIQTLRIHGLMVKEQGDHFMIYHASSLNLGNMARVISEDVPGAVPRDSLVVTQVFRLNTISASSASTLLTPALSSNAIIGVVNETNQIVITDVIANLQQVTQLLRSIDSPGSGMVVGQYVAKNPAALDRLLELSERILMPIAQGQPYSLIPHPTAGSVFIVSSPFLVEKGISIMQHIDQNQAATKILDLEELKLTKTTEFGWQLDANGSWIFRSKFPLLFTNKEGPAPGHWVVNKKGEWEYLLDQILKTGVGEWKKGQNGNWYFIPKEEEDVPLPPTGEWRQARDGSWYFVPNQTKNETTPPKSSKLPSQPISPQGKWKRDVDGTWFFVPEPAQTGLVPPDGQWNRATDGTWYYGVLSKSNKEFPEGSWATTPFGVVHFRPAPETEGPGSIGADPLNNLNAPGQWVKSVKGRWIFELQKGLAPSLSGALGSMPSEQEYMLEYGAGPVGDWILDENGIWVFKLAAGEKHMVDRLTWESSGGEVLGIRKEDKPKFYLHKIRYVDADKVQATLLQIAQSMSYGGESIDEEFVKVLNGTQTMPSANGLILSGTEKNLEKARELIDQIDIPIRQVFIEMLILDTTLSDSLTYGVNFQARFGGSDWSGAEGFNSILPLTPSMNTAGVQNGVPLIPDASLLGSLNGFNLGIIGQHITHAGMQFNSLGALIDAIHENTFSNVVMNPKVLVENNSSASLFVGINTAFKTQSISNDQGSVLTNNFEFRDVGTRLDVKATISSNDIITLDIEQEVSRVVSQNTTDAGKSTQPVGPTTSINRTKTRVHIPDGYFLVISGMVSDDNTRIRNQVPCLGGFPILGSAFSYKKGTDDKRNLMIFLRPKIVETGEEIDEYTRRQQDIYKDKIRDRFRNLWDEEVEEAFDFMNLKDTSPEAIPCDSCKLP